MDFIDKMKRLAEETAKQNRLWGDEKKLMKLEVISELCKRISDKVAGDVERDAKGQGLLKGTPIGRVLYLLADEDGNIGGRDFINDLLHGLHNDDLLNIDPTVYTLEDISDISVQDIEATPGFQTLRRQCQELGLKLEVEENDLQDNYIIMVSGWGIV